jgi:hypothetical protein
VASSGCHLAHPVQKRDQAIDLGIAQVLLGHEPAVALFVVELGRVFQEGLQVGRTALLRNLGQVGCVVSTFAKQGVAVDAVVLVPDILAQGDRGRDVLGVCQFWKLAVAVHGETEKNQCGDQR